MTLLENVHGSYVFLRRLRVLSRHISEMLPQGVNVLDVGCGSGELAEAVVAARPDIRIEGLDILVRNDTHIPVRQFDGWTLPTKDKSVDIVMFIDVLHHAIDPLRLLQEADRVCRRGILIKDHTRDGLLARETLRFMDRVGNRRFGVALPYNYWSWAEWHRAFEQLDWSLELLRKQLGLYPAPAGWIFERSLHFAALLRTPRAMQII